MAVNLEQLISQFKQAARIRQVLDDLGADDGIGTVFTQVQFKKIAAFVPAVPVDAQIRLRAAVSLIGFIAAAEVEGLAAAVTVQGRFNLAWDSCWTRAREPDQSMGLGFMVNVV